MSIVFSKDGTELLKLIPSEFRRVYTIDIENNMELKYSHSDVVVLLENGSKAMIEICQGMLNSGSYVIKTEPCDVTFDIRLTKTGGSCMNWLKKIVFMTFPDLDCCDYYGNKEIESSIHMRHH